MTVTPLPLRQVVPIALIQTVSSFCMNIVTPISPFMVEDFFPELDSREVGYYSGYLVAAYFVGQFLGGMVWGHLSDRFGRRPIIISGLVSTSLSVALFAFSPNYYQAVVARFLWGALNGNIGVVKTYLSEVCDDSNQAKGMAILSTSFGFGQMLGPAVGGLLARPAQNWGAFKDVRLFLWFPYLLSCVPAILFCLLGAVGAYFFLPETHAGIGSRYNTLHDDVPKTEDPEAAGAGDGASANLGGSAAQQTQALSPVPFHGPSLTSSPPPAPVGYCQLLRGGAFLPILAYALLGLSVIGFTTIFPLLLLSEDQAAGGFGYGTATIGTLLAFAGPVQIFVAPVVFPWLAARVGCRRILQTIPATWGCVVALVPFAAALPAIDWLRFSVLATAFVAHSFLQIMSYTSVFILINNSAPKALRARVNGLGQSGVSMARLISPSLFSTLFAATCGASLPWPLDFHCAFHAVGLLGVVTALVSLALPERLDRKPEEGAFPVK